MKKCYKKVKKSENKLFEQTFEHESVVLESLEDKISNENLKISHELRVR